LKVVNRTTIASTLRSLESVGILISGVYNKKKYDQTKWYRLNYEKLCEVLGKSEGELCQVLTHPHVNIRQVHVSKFDPTIPKNSPKEIKQIEHAATQPKPTDFPELEASTGGEEMLPKNGLKKGPTSVQETLEKLATTTKEKHNSKIMELYILWAVTVPKHHDEVKFVSKFTRKQEAQMLMLAKAWPDAGKVLEHVLIRWVKFGKLVVSQTDAKSYPSIPSTDFVVKHKDIAMNFYLAATKVPEEKVLMKPGAINCTEEPKPVKVVEPEKLVQKVSIGKTLIFGKKAPGTVAVAEGGGEDKQSKAELKQQLLKELLKG